MPSAMGNNCPEMNLMDSSIVPIRWPEVEDAPTPYTHRGAILPANLRESLDRYARYGVPTGGFLRAVLQNDLHGAIGRADANNLAALPAIVAYVYNCLPRECCGNTAKINAHIDLWGPRSEEFFRVNRLRQAANNKSVGDGLEKTRIGSLHNGDYEALDREWLAADIRDADDRVM